MGKPYRISIPLYNHRIYVYYSLDDYTGEDYPKGASAVTWEIVAGVHCTTIVFRDWSIENAAHEATHAIFAMLKYIGLPVTHEGQEAVAYPLGYLVSEIVKGKEKWDAKQTDSKADSLQPTDSSPKPTKEYAVRTKPYIAR